MAKEETKDFLKERAWLSGICDSQSTEELENKYDTWANSYDTDVQKDWSFIPVNIAKTLRQLLPDKNCSILDAGAGTGLVGEALAKEGYTNLTAVDLSEQMLAIAREKQVYQNLSLGNLEDSDILENSEKFDAIITAGVFAYAHAGEKVLNNLFSFLKDEKFFLLTIREDYRQQMQTALDQLSWQLVREESFPIYDEAKLMYLLAFKKKSQS
ncbi:class I SAM-dependent DNA methyltransferase [Haliea sp.]